MDIYIYSKHTRKPYVSLSLPMSFVFPKILISRGPKRDSSISANQQVYIFTLKRVQRLFCVAARACYNFLKTAKPHRTQPHANSAPLHPGSHPTPNPPSPKPTTTWNKISAKNTSALRLPTKKQLESFRR